MKIIRYTLLADGSSDEVLLSIIDWLILQHFPGCSVLGTFAKDFGKVGLDLRSRIPAALKFFPCDIFFIHRDSEGQGLKQRINEIDMAVKDIQIKNFVPIIPVRMTEAWLLSDENAIRSAAGNKNGKIDLRLPNRKNLEDQSDPKNILVDALILASEKTGRALKKFNPLKERALVAKRTTSFAALRGLPSFDFFEARLVNTLNGILENALD
jgi:hypothetical protein